MNIAVILMNNEIQAILYLYKDGTAKYSNQAIPIEKTQRTETISFKVNESELMKADSLSRKFKFKDRSKFFRWIINSIDEDFIRKNI